MLKETFRNRVGVYISGGGFMASKHDRKREEHLIHVLRKQAQRYLRLPNVTSVGVGRKIVAGKQTDELCIQFTVSRKLAPEQLEKESLESLPEIFVDEDGSKISTDILERSYKPSHQIVGHLSKCTAEESEPPHDIRRRRLEKVQPGVSISHYSGTAGTLGAIVYDKQSGQPLLLSNWHVLAGNGAQVGDQIVQPGPFDDGDISHNHIGKLERSHLGLAGDCAVSTIQMRSFQENILELECAPRIVAKAQLDDKVVKSGRTTGVTYGIVSRVGVVVSINYGGATGVVQIGGFEITPNPNRPSENGEISMGGDSGSLWVIDSGQTDEAIAVGLHFAGETDPDPSAEHALACNIHSVLEKLDISLLDPSEEMLTTEQLWNETLGRIHALEQQIAILSSQSKAESQCSCSSSKSKQPPVSPEAGIPVYGNWCGPGHGGGTPVDDLDRACMHHDDCYAKYGYFDCQCDRELVSRIGQALASGNVQGNGKFIGPLVAAYFAQSPCKPRAITTVVDAGKNVWKKIKSWF